MPNWPPDRRVNGEVDCKILIDTVRVKELIDYAAQQFAEALCASAIWVSLVFTGTVSVIFGGSYLAYCVFDLMSR